MIDLENKADKLIDKYNMIGPGGKVLVGFSGGSDSCALLYYLIKKLGRENIYAAHLNHGIRGADADADEKFAVEICEGYNIKIYTEHLNVPELAERYKKSIEETARDERYKFFRRISEKLSGDIKIATAHTAGDNTESVIINLARGTGTAGLCGIAPAINNIIRPLLTCEKREILAYCKLNNIDYIEDNSNTDESYTRNFIRHSIAAKLRERYAGLDSSILKMCEIMRDTDDYISAQAENILKEYGGAGLPVGVYKAQHLALRRVIIIKMCGLAGGEIDYKLICELDAALLAGKLVRQDLPGGCAAAVLDGVFMIYREEQDYRAKRRAGKFR